MRKNLTGYIPLIPVVILLGMIVFSNSCANTTQAPTGGVKDTIPPLIVKMSPELYSKNVPVQGTSFTFTFNEYVKVKSSAGIILSPPQSRPLKSKIKGKSLLVTPEEPLLPNTTYTIEFVDAIADNNEGNVFPGFTYVFSTGETIDSLMISGTVLDCSTLAPVKGATVMLYKDHADSAVMLSRPYMATKTDDWGFFALRNIQDTLYRLYAVTDANSNNLYDTDGSENIAFIDSLIRPVTVVNDSLPEVQKYDMKDTLACLARKSEYELSIFREKPSKQMIMNRKRIDRRSGYITFLAPSAHIDSLWISGIPSSRIITQFNVQRDSLELWVNDKRRMPDTLKMYVNYRKTDTLGRLISETELVKLSMEQETKNAEKKARKAGQADTTCAFELKVDPTTVEQIGFQLEFKYPIVSQQFDSLVFTSVNPKQVSAKAKYIVQPDSLNLRRYSILPEDKLQTGFDYILKVPHRAFQDINGYFSDSTEVKVTLPTDEKLSSFNINISGVEDKRYIVDMMNEKKSSILRTYIVDSDAVLSFPYLKAGKYCFRITEDANKNTIVDTGSLLGHRQPEKVKFLKVNDDTLIEIPEKAVVDLSVDIKELF